jgi:hypothetical protein
MARHRLLKAARALKDKGTIPPGVDPAHHRVRSAAIVLPVDKSYIDIADEALTVIAGKAQTSV